jgi:hypothetical protein
VVDTASGPQPDATTLCGSALGVGLLANDFVYAGEPGAFQSIRLVQGSEVGGTVSDVHSDGPNRGGFTFAVQPGFVGMAGFRYVVEGASIITGQATVAIYVSASATGELDGDVDGDGDVDRADLAMLTRYFGTEGGANIRGDLNGDGSVGLRDLVLLRERMATPALPAMPIRAAASPSVAVLAAQRNPLAPTAVDLLLTDAGRPRMDVLILSRRPEPPRLAPIPADRFPNDTNVPHSTAPSDASAGPRRLRSNRTARRGTPSVESLLSAARETQRGGGFLFDAVATGT